MPRRFLIPLLIVAAALLAFGRVVSHDFTSWDDASTIAYNPNLNPPTSSGLAAMWRSPHMGLYVPVTYTVWSGVALLAHGPSNARGVQLRPAFFHAANLALHALAALVVFAILRLLLRHDWAAGAGALFFALHPVQVEPVAWASGLKDVLCGLLTLTAIWQYLLFITLKRGSHYRLATLAFLLAMLAKPTAVVAPLMAFSLDVLIVRRSPRLAIRSLAPWVLMAIPCAIAAKIFQPGTDVDAGPLWARPLVAVDAIAFYLRQLLWPVRLGIDYGRRPQTAVNSAWLGVARLIVLGWAAYHLFATSADRREDRTTSLEKSFARASLLLFLIPLLPVLGFTPFMFQAISTVADHYLYLAMLGPALMTAWVIRRWPRRTTGFACVILFAALGMRSYLQSATWRDDFTLYRQAITANPQSTVGYVNLGQAHEMHRQLAVAEECYAAAVAVRPDFQIAHQDLGACLAYEGKMDAAIVELREAQRLEASKPSETRRDLTEAFYGLGEILLAGHHDADAARLFAELLRQKPGDTRATQQLAKIRERASAVMSDEAGPP